MPAAGLKISALFSEWDPPTGLLPATTSGLPSSSSTAAPPERPVVKSPVGVQLAAPAVLAARAKPAAAISAATANALRIRTAAKRASIWRVLPVGASVATPTL